MKTQSSNLTRDEAEMIVASSEQYALAARRTDRSHSTDLDDSSARVWGVYDMTTRQWLTNDDCCDFLDQLRNDRNVDAATEKAP